MPESSSNWFCRLSVQFCQFCQLCQFSVRVCESVPMMEGRSSKVGGSVLVIPWPKLTELFLIQSLLKFVKNHEMCKKMQGSHCLGCPYTEYKNIWVAMPAKKKLAKSWNCCPLPWAVPPPPTYPYRGTRAHEISHWNQTRKEIGEGGSGRVDLKGRRESSPGSILPTLQFNHWSYWKTEITVDKTIREKVMGKSYFGNFFDFFFGE